MMKDGLKGKFDLIITKSISRFARNTLDSLMAIRKLKEKNVEIYFEKENIWTLDSKGELLITIMSSIAQEESRSISMNVTWGIRESMKKGMAYVPYKVFLGYDKGLEKGEMIINNEQAKIVKKIFAMALMNMSSYAIAKYMEEHHIPFSKDVYKWHASTVKSILRNEKYKGDALRQKTYTIDYLSKTAKKNRGEIAQYYIHNHHPAIIKEDIFDRLQDDLNHQVKDTDYIRSRNYLFSKRIICSCCHGYYGPILWHKGTNSESLVWRCNQKFKRDKSNRCITPSLKESYIKDLIIDDINKMFTNNIKATIFNNLHRYLKNNKKASSYLKSIIDKDNIIQTFNDEMWYILFNNLIIYDKHKITIIHKDETIIKNIIRNKQ